MNKTTPAPWRVLDENFIIGENLNIVCQAFNFKDEDFNNKEANLKLIATAPEMLEVLKKCAEIYYWSEDGELHTTCAICLQSHGHSEDCFLDKIIKKAEGE